MWEQGAFLFLTVYVFWKSIKLKKPIKAFGTGQSLIGINETAKNYAGILPLQIDICALSCCNYVPKLYYTRKKTVIKHLIYQTRSLQSLGDTAASLVDVYAKSTKLISSYYGIKNANNYLKYGFQTGENEPEGS